MKGPPLWPFKWWTSDLPAPSHLLLSITWTLLQPWSSLQNTLLGARKILFMVIGWKWILLYICTVFTSLGTTGRKLEILRAVTEIRILVFAGSGFPDFITVLLHLQNYYVWFVGIETNALHCNSFTL